MIKPKTLIQVLEKITDKHGQYVILKCKVESEEYILANIYVPNNDNPMFFDTLFEKTDSLNVDLKIISGDFNLVLDLVGDKRWGSNVTHTQAANSVHAYLMHNNLIDPWRDMNPDKSIFTWYRTNPNPIFVRLDYFLVSERIYQTVSHTDILPSFKSDHSLPVMNISIGNNDRGPGYWKFNVSLLEDKEFVAQLGNHIEIEAAQNHPNILTKWEVLKLSIRNYTLKHATRKTNSNNNKLMALEKKLKMVQDTLHTQTIFTESETQIISIKKEINDLIEVITRGAMMRSKANWIMAREKPTNYFLGMEKKES